MMVVEANEGSSVTMDLFTQDDFDNDVVFDLDALWRLVGGNPDSPQGGRLEDLPFIDAFKGEQSSAVFPTEDELLGFGEQSMPYYSGRSEFGMECSESERFQPSLKIDQDNVLFYTVTDGGLQNDSSSYRNDSKQAPFETLNHNEQMNFPIEGNFIHSPGSSDLNKKVPFGAHSNGDSSSFDGPNIVIHERDSSNFSHLIHEEDLFGTSEYSESCAIRNRWRSPFNTASSENCNDIVTRDTDAVNDVLGGGLYYGGLGQMSSTEDVEWSPPIFSENPGILPTPSVKVETNPLKFENETPKTYQGVKPNTVAQIIVDDDSDLCILEDMSAPAHPTRIAANAKLSVTSHYSTSRSSGVQTATAHSRLKTNDERVIFRVALQDLTQPKSETTPPDGLLSVALLKHQRIALSWMVNKETKSACCSGGILADDQGLGKTISTIALILKERAPSSKSLKFNGAKSETETFNLDDDDDDDDVDGVSQAEPHRIHGSPINGCKNSLIAKGRPSGGTLVVCPTSVLRQWSEELHHKVTREADLSVLVYHGSNRTKDPLELAQYDVVVTTYAIVSMEVPKQPVVNENENLIDSPYKEFKLPGKRKLCQTVPGKNSCRSKKSRKGIANELLENTYGPLAQVGWFRVVLDEAQSIKNHRTQVARACWGLRAKRRWCLSGTPIQNAIDDLYSYFRFLRHEPYAVFRTFVEQLKVPIHRNPRNGYKKLQAVLKTIMLRRTKGTFIDGEPIINLPPKTVELKKVDFSMEERDFYCRLEADSRAQFAEYAAAGTVKQNYVNILLMLLRLRQACDHPLLVKGFSSNSKLTSSIEMAKKLSREKQDFLLSCLEASLAICGICSDPPEDAVVTVCGHVFCHQCICEHLIGDGTQCPTKKCKTHLTMACVFSITTLQNALSDQSSTENTSIRTDCESSEVSEPHLSMSPHDSSKIKAALHILLSLSVRKNYVCDSGDVIGISDMDRDSNNPYNVVPEKAIVFSQWTGMLDLLEACLKNTSIQYRRLDGTMPVAARDRAVKDFNSLPKVSVMIMSLKAASLGLNLVAACNVLLLDLWWNPTTEDQAIDRAHRIGQTRAVSVYRLTVKDTVEDRILALQQRKRKMVASAFGENETGTRQTRLTVDDLKYLFRA